MLINISSIFLDSLLAFGSLFGSSEGQSVILPSPDRDFVKMSIQRSPIVRSSKGRLATSLESLDQRLNVQILARCIGSALNLGAPLRVEVHYTSKVQQ